MSLSRPNPQSNMDTNFQGKMPMSSGITTSTYQQGPLPSNINSNPNLQQNFPVNTNNSMMNQMGTIPITGNLGISQLGNLPVNTNTDMRNQPQNMLVSTNPMMQQSNMPTNESMNLAGNIVIRPLTARITRSTSFFGKMDPLVKVIVGSHFQKTPAARKGHKNPGWETELSMRRAMNEDYLTLELWDRDIASADDFIAVTELPFNYLISAGNRFNGWLRLRHKGKNVGELLVDVVFIPDHKKDSMVNKSNMVSQSARGIDSMPRLEIDESKILENDPNKNVRKRSIGTAYTYPLQGETHTSYSPTNKFDKETMTTRRNFYQEPKAQLGNYIDAGTSMMEESKKSTGFSQVMPTTLKDYEVVDTNPGDIISGYYDKDRMDRSNKVRTMERNRSVDRSMNRSMDKGQMEDQASSYYQSNMPLNRSGEKRSVQSGMERHVVYTADQAM